MRSSLLPVTLLGALLLAPTTGFGSGVQSETATTFGPVSTGLALPTFAAYNHDGQFVRSKELIEAAKGGGLIVSFFATWCTACRNGMPVIEKQIAAHTGWQSVFIDFGEEPAKVDPWVAGLHLAGIVLYDENAYIGKRFGVAETLPKTFVVGPSGNVGTIFVVEGEDFGEKLAAAMSAAK